MVHPTNKNNELIDFNIITVKLELNTAFISRNLLNVIYIINIKYIILYIIHIQNKNIYEDILMRIFLFKHLLDEIK